MEINGDVGNLTSPAVNKTPEPMVTKFGVGDEVGDPLVLSSAYSQEPCTDFHDQYVRWRRFTKDVPFGGLEYRILHFDLIFKETQIFGQLLTGQNFASIDLDNSDAHLYP